MYRDAQTANKSTESFLLDPSKNENKNFHLGTPRQQAEPGFQVGGSQLKAQLKRIGARMGKMRRLASGGVLVRGAIDFNTVLGLWL